MQLSIGITGGIGSGKSTLCKAIEKLGYPVFYSDPEAKRILNTPEVHEELQSVFGLHVFNHGKVDRAALASIVFSDSSALEKLNSIIHPRVRQVFAHWRKQQTSSLIFKEAALLIENSDPTIDYLVCVLCSEKERIRRVVKRDGATPELVRQRMTHQVSDDIRREKADTIIENDQYDRVLPQLLKMISLLNRKIT